MVKDKGTPGTITDPKKALAYMLQPNSNIITFQSAKTGERRTFRINPMDKLAVAEKGIRDQRFFVKFLSGSDNSNDYTYLGQILNGRFTLTQKSRTNGITEQTPSYVIFKVAFETLLATTVMPKMLQVTHSGRCGKCHKALTVPQSVNDGFGPECIEKVMATAPCPVPEIDTRILKGITSPAAPTKSCIHTQHGTECRTPFLCARASRESGRPAPTKTVRRNGVDVPLELDARIRQAIDLYKSEGPENYYHDGELKEEEAFKVAYNRFYHDLMGKR